MRLERALIGDFAWRYHERFSTFVRIESLMPNIDFDYELLRLITDQPIANKWGMASRMSVSVGVGKISYCGKRSSARPGSRPTIFGAAITSGPATIF